MHGLYISKLDFRTDILSPYWYKSIENDKITANLKVKGINEGYEVRCLYHQHS